MKYYRLIFKEEDGKVMFSQILEQEMNKVDFETMNWTSPIIRHEMAGHIHFIALDREYLDAMLLGVGTYQALSGIAQVENGTEQ